MNENRSYYENSLAYSLHDDRSVYEPMSIKTSGLLADVSSIDLIEEFKQTKSKILAEYGDNFLKVED